jgi:hypothetical protein
VVEAPQATPPTPARAARIAHAASGGSSRQSALEARRLSVGEQAAGSGRGRIADIIAGYVAAAAIFGGIVSLFYYPGRIGPAAIFCAVLAAGIGGGIRRFTGLAAAVAGFGFLFGLVIAVFLDRPLF